MAELDPKKQKLIDLIKSKSLYQPSDKGGISWKDAYTGKDYSIDPTAGIAVPIKGTAELTKNALRSLINPEIKAFQETGQVGKELLEKLKSLPTEESPAVINNKILAKTLRGEPVSTIAGPTKALDVEKMIAQEKNIPTQTKMFSAGAPTMPEDNQKYPMIKQTIQKDPKVQKQDELLKIMENGSDEEKAKAMQEMLELVPSMYENK